ncbi:chemotaxis protein CheD [Paracoccus xiamenensis]|uniref:chemotaxis protein CheD n=1 Tax=Paracoccus xiamenensis TaxID=2714901 RepID=UPI001409DA31|nr:chemotaxis protein CheD [Paracoccus xiamenensis]NHF72494.1 chemotaxis protein CheD [Paracoccus xiamenensis]
MRGGERIHLIQGEYRVMREGGDSCLTTVLGSCVSVCLIDPLFHVGGMNHFLLPTGQTGGASSASYGVNAMELLIDEMIKAGAHQRRLRAHVFGGARMMSGLGNVGDRNAEFARDFLTQKGIRIAGISTGGTAARRVTLWPATCRVKEELIGDTVVERPITLPKADDA